MRGRNANSKSQRDLLGLLDIGTAKIACAIARRRQGEKGPYLDIIATGYHAARGMKSGVVTNLDDAETSVRAAVAKAERKAGVTLDEVVVAVSCGRIKSSSFAAHADIENGVVSAADARRAMAGARAYAERDGRTLLHMNTIGCKLDGVPSGDDPHGLAARQLTLDLHAVTADASPLRNVQLLVERCYLGVIGLVATPFASALAVTSEDERQFGVTVLDIGAGTTSIASFWDSRLVYIAVIPMGGQHVTFDIARSLEAPITEAERVKALFGTLSAAQSDAHETFNYALAEQEEGATFNATRAALTDAIRPRMAQIMALVLEKFHQAAAPPFATSQVVLTGGASQLIGLADFAAEHLGRPVRVGRLNSGIGLGDEMAGPAFSALSGLALFAASQNAQSLIQREARADETSYLGRVGSWLRGGF